MHPRVIAHYFPHLFPSPMVPASERSQARPDHHCFWINTCVGERNHPDFLAFLLAQSVLALWSVLILGSAFPSQGNEGTT